MIKKLHWDSEFFSLQIGEIITAEKSVDAKQDFDLLYFKSQQDNNLLLTGYTNSFSEEKVIYCLDLKVSKIVSPNIFSFIKAEFLKEELYYLAYESGKYSRFKLDSRFHLEDFKKLYRTWVDNSLKGEFSDDVLLYQKQNEILGFVTYKINDSVASIGLIAVSPNHQGKGIGKQLLNFVENKLFQCQIQKLIIPTQRSNSTACAFYEHMGYKESEKIFISHYWKI